jgi:hypothetical protein
MQTVTEEQARELICHRAISAGLITKCFGIHCMAFCRFPLQIEGKDVFVCTDLKPIEG